MLVKTLYTLKDTQESGTVGVLWRTPGKAVVNVARRGFTKDILYLL